MKNLTEKDRLKLAGFELIRLLTDDEVIVIDPEAFAEQNNENKPLSDIGSLPR